jgi:hypothetical protein
MRWCTAAEAGAAPGRWVARAAAIHARMYTSEDLDRVERLDWIWIPYGCRIRLLAASDVRTCFDQQQISLYMLGSSVERTYFFNLLRLLGIEFTPSKDTQIFRATDRFAYRKSSTFAFCEKFVEHSSHLSRYCTTFRDTLKVQFDAFARLQGNKTTDVLLLDSMWVYGGYLKQFAANATMPLREVLQGYQGRPICSTPFVVHQHRCDFMKTRWFSASLPRSRWMHRWVVDQAREARCLLFDVQSMVLPRDDASDDCIHYYEENMMVGGTVMRMVVHALLNMICPADSNRVQS